MLKVRFLRTIMYMTNSQACHIIAYLCVFINMELEVGNKMKLSGKCLTFSEQTLFL